MGHEAKAEGLLCDVLDELEAAITTKRAVRVWLEDGDHKMGQPTDIFIKDDQDFLRMEQHLPIPVSRIVRVERL